jgi:GT2 family glycosyltransferase
MDEHSVWVGVLDLDGPGDVRRVNGPLSASHQQVRLLVCMHQAPLGFVRVPALPQESLAKRARTAAGTDLAQAIQQHAQCHDQENDLAGPARWASLTSCPRRFPISGEGITVVVCTRDRPEELRDCLNAMQHFRYEPLEILVVDNAPSADDTRNLVSIASKADPRIRYTCESSPGLSRARNHALLQARYELVAFTDDDTFADPGWPAALAAGFGDDPETLCVTGFVAASSLETSSERYFDARYSGRQAFEPHRYDLGFRPTKLYPYAAGIFGTGANFAVRRDALLKLGGFDLLLGAGSPCRGGEDLDMFLRVILAGGRIRYVPSAIIWHRHRVNAPALREQIYSYGNGLGAYIAKHLGSRELRTALLAHGLQQAGLTIKALRRAALGSQLGLGATRYALSEVRGVVAGAWSYRQASR